MPTNLCLVCHFKNACKKNTENDAKCNHRYIVKKMIHHLSMDLEEIDVQNADDKEINILAKLLAE